MTGRIYMTYPLVLQPIAPAEYGELLRHCTGCTSCREVPDRECSFAAGLRRQWSAAGRAARARRGV
ncbi:hypothetical protein ACFYPC_08735 [Streptomyces sp. NPDC005808]|uniref:hypothetical protein n=1 Tax=Streptomyces sp. NPDC005808 TaxID=3364734 RepID=UPI003680F858